MLMKRKPIPIKDRSRNKGHRTNLSALISENFFGFQDKSKFPTQSKLPSYSTPFTVNPVSLYLKYWQKNIN